MIITFINCQFVVDEKENQIGMKKSIKKLNRMKNDNFGWTM